MNLLFKLLPRNLPAFIREEILTELFKATAEAFECPLPAVDHLSYDDYLQAYAQFTSEQAEKALQSGRGPVIGTTKGPAGPITPAERGRGPVQGPLTPAERGRDIPIIKTHLYRAAYPLGAKLRERLGVDSMEEVMALGQILYQAIGVDFEGDSGGSVTVSRCYFSRFYSAPVCDLISALDDGVFSGLSGGGRLSFSERITDGRSCCRARLTSREEGIR